MKTKTLILGTLLALCAPFAAEAQMTTTESSESYENYQVSCSPNSENYDPTNAECDTFDVNYEAESTDNSEYSQRRTRRSRSRSGDDVRKPYAGASLGIFFPEDDLETGFGGSIFGGYKFTPNLSGEAEFLAYFGGIDNIPENSIFDDDFSVLGFLANARFEYPFNQAKSNSPVGFIAPGLGLAIADGAGDSNTEFAFQVKGGVSFPVKERLDVFAQGRFLGIDDFNTFSVEGGVTFGFE